MLMHITRAGSNPFFFMLGISAVDLAASAPPLVEGRYFDTAATAEIVIGKSAASDLDAGSDAVAAYLRRSA